MSLFHMTRVLLDTGLPYAASYLLSEQRGMKYDDLLRDIGDFGRYQKNVCAIIFLAGIPNAFFIVSFAFTQFKTDFRCRMLGNDTDDPSLTRNSSSRSWSELHVWKSDECEFHRTESSGVSHGNNASIKVPCTSGWEYQDENTAIAEFNLVCDDAWKPAFVVTLYMLGMLAGSLAGSLCDRFGRRPMYLFFSYLQFASAGFTGCAWNFESYAIGTFIMGTCGFAGYNIAMTLSTEIICSRRQGFVTALNLCSYVAGFMLTPLISFFLPNWRWYLRFCGFVGVLYFLPLLRFFPESARWQLISGRTREAKLTVQAIAKTNGKSVDVEELFDRFDVIPKDVEDENAHSKYAKDDSLIQIYLRSPILRKRFLTLNFYWFLSSLLYFAISLNPIKPGSNRYIHVLLVGFAEIPGYLFGYLVSRYFGLCWCLVISAGLAGAACLSIPFFLTASGAVTSTITFLGKCFCSAGYAYVSISVLRVAPTLVRHSSVGIASASGKLGGIIMPYLMHSGEGNSLDLPYFAMGVAAFVSAFFVFLFIPDTRNGIPDTVREAESDQSNYLAFFWRKLESRYHHRPGAPSGESEEYPTEKLLSSKDLQDLNLVPKKGYSPTDQL